MNEAHSFISALHDTMSREEWWDQEITSIVIVLTITCDTMPWLSPGSWISHGVAECHTLLEHLLPEHLYNLSVVTEHVPRKYIATCQQ